MSFIGYKAHNIKDMNKECTILEFLNNESKHSETSAIVVYSDGALVEVPIRFLKLSIKDNKFVIAEQLP